MNGWARTEAENVQERPLLKPEELNSDIEQSEDEEEELEWKEDANRLNRSVLSSLVRTWWSPFLRTLFVILTIGVITSYFVPWRHLSSSKPTPIPARLRPQEDYILNPNWDFNAAPTRREYNWTISDHELNPDGVYRSMILINSQFPGPLIECNEGDEIWIHVHNRAVNATSFHWHGLYQNGTNWMDGTVGISQCPIAPGADFTYKFRVENQSGTYWYHSHMGVQASDGLVGPFVIHSKKEKDLQKVPYTSDRVVMVQDHYYDLSGALLMHYLEPDRENAEPVPDSALINGRNVRNCDDVPSRKCDNSTATHAQFLLEKGQNHRLRIINVGAFAEFQMQFDEHEFAVTEVDGTYVTPEYFHRLNINSAQRYSVIINATNEHSDAFWLRARMITHCFAEEKPEMAEEVRGILQYTLVATPENSKYDITTELKAPTSKDWTETIELICKDLNTTLLHPVEAVAVPEKADTQIYLRSNFEIGAWKLSRGFFNSSSYRPNLTSPSLQRAITGLKTSNFSFTNSLATPYGINSQAFYIERELVYTTTGLRVIDILIQNFDDGNHPMHLHGYKFFVLAQGHGYPPASLYSTLDLSNPLRRDTASVEAFGWTLLRFVADNPGMWPLHCHISWHSEAGLLMQFLVQAEKVAKIEVPEEVQELCQAEGIERGKGPEDDIWFGQ
ncbi:putative multicopper oxidase, type 1 [Delitschia confertaspora ATCC 74209]|uniref:Multicopper oxidase, type 1 n=1 Tax=Delitschia confertaspora ATCC 74209 TaxID=1513339 RepID=A0A9P4JUQ2_9PLEO|nr:putative multicopper oxidase, type 1 [Delitschia confertaspora ATCC 74209]